MKHRIVIYQNGSQNVNYYVLLPPKASVARQCLLFSDFISALAWPRDLAGQFEICCRHVVAWPGQKPGFAGNLNHSPPDSHEQHILHTILYVYKYM